MNEIQEEASQRAFLLKKLIKECKTNDSAAWLLIVVTDFMQAIAQQSDGTPIDTITNACQLMIDTINEVRNAQEKH